VTPAGSLFDDAISLFREAPEDFIAARDHLVAELLERGHGDDAKVVKALRKPTVVAWALNQLAVRDPGGVQSLLDSGAEVRAAQQAALSSKRGATDRLQAAGAARRGAIARLNAVATAALAEAGRSPQAHTAEIARALETCSVDVEAGAALASGTLERPPAATPGFGDVFGLTSLQGGAENESPDPDDHAALSTGTNKPPARAKTGATDTTEHRAEVAGLRRDRDALARLAKRSRQAADGFAHELEGMRKRLEVVERKHADAASAAGEAETKLGRAEKALRRATARAEGA
jgi:hypothetical protein